MRSSCTLAKKFGRSGLAARNASCRSAPYSAGFRLRQARSPMGPAPRALVTVFGYPFNAEEVIARAHAVLALLDAELKGRDWIAAEHPTIADVALYSYVARAPEGNVDTSLAIRT